MTGSENWVDLGEEESDMPPSFAASVSRALGLITEFMNKVTRRRSRVKGVRQE